MPNTQPTNDEIADLLERIGSLLQAQDANDFRVRAYRDGAQTVRSADQSIAQMAEQEGLDALIDLPEIGDGLARVIGEYVSEGRSRLLDQLESEVSPVDLFARVPGIGPKLAQRIIDTLDIHSLEALEMAAHDGRLDRVEGFGAQRVQDVRNGLAGMLSQSARRDMRQRTADEGSEAKRTADRPPVPLILEIDAEYRRKAEADTLKRIAPKRFNPDDEAWLPIMNVEREGWNFTALFSNTARAHELEKTDDWVVIYYKPSEGGRERQHTVVTETKGKLEGKRVVRGREAETRQHYGL